jgi:hypothetical protein
MSLIDDVEAEFTKAESSLSDVIGFFTGKAKDALKTKIAALEADEEKLKGEVKDELAKAKAAALADVQANAPQAATDVSKALEAVEAAIVAALEKHLVP